MLTKDFDFHLPQNLIAQKPAKPRDHSRLLILDKKSGVMEHGKFYNVLDPLSAGDVLVLNDSKVIPARLLGRKETGGKVEIFLLTKKETRIWEVMIGGKVRAGQKIILSENIIVELFQRIDDKTWLVKFNASDKKIFALGETPTPPYIKSKSKMVDYQTVYAKKAGSVAAPTAGLHFTPRLLEKIKAKGVKVAYITLHVGLGTFLPVKADDLAEHRMHSELAMISPTTAKKINLAKAKGGRIIAVGTTSARTLEAMTDKKGELTVGKKWVDIFIYPSYQFKIVDALVTNFHLPKSTLIMLVSALAGQDKIKKAYREAIKKKYKFYSFGDAMLIKED